MLDHWVIVGATSDIAKAFVSMPSFQPKSLLLCARNTELLSQLTEDLKIRKPQSQIQGITIDLSQTDKASWLAMLIQKTFQEPYGVIYFAGVLDDQEISTKEKIVAMTNVNYLFPVLLIEELFQNPKISFCRSVVVVGSVAGERGRAKNYRYGATKAAIATYLSGLRQRLNPQGVHVLTVKPGFVKTKMIRHLTKTPLATTPDRVAKDIWKAIQKQKWVVYTPPIMKWLMVIVRLLPEKWFMKVKL